MSQFTLLTLIILSIYVVLGYKRPRIAFTTVPIVVFIVGYIAVEAEIEEFLVLAPTLFVGTMMAVAASGVKRGSREWVHWWAWWILITIVAFLVLGLILVGLRAFNVSYIVPLLFILAIIAVIASLVNYGLASRRVTVMNVFSTIGSSVRQSLPLPMALDCAAAGHECTTALILRSVGTWLVKGYSLTEALRRGYPQCPARAVAMVSAGARVDQLPAALTAIETDLKANTMEQRRLRPVHPFYPVVVLSLALLLVLGLMTFVIPSFKGVLEETTGEHLPTSTRVLLGITETLVHGTNGVALLGLLALVVAGPWLYRKSRQRRPEKPYFHSWIIDALKWCLPIVHWFERNRSMVQVVELLRMSLQAGCPVNEAIRGTLPLDVNLFFRSRLVCWLRRVERGEDIGESARRSGLGTALAWAFSGAQRGNTPAVLEMLESHYRSNYSYRVNLARFILWPCGIILLGATVGFIVYAIFSPGVAVIEQLSGTIYP
jgi:type II secretory pathway component PulF